MTDYDPQAQPQQGGSSWWKWCLAIGCVFLLLGGVATGVVVFFAASVVGQMIPVTDPVQVQQRLSAILPSQPPPGYEGVMAMSIPGVFQMAVIAPQGFQQQGQQAGNPPPLMLMVCTLPPGSRTDEMKRKMQDALEQAQQNGGGGGQGELIVEAEEGESGTVQQSISVRGEAIKLEQTVGRSKDGSRVKQVVLLVPRKKGSDELVMVLGMGQADAFDQAALDAYLQSIE